MKPLYFERRTPNCDHSASICVNLLLMDTLGTQQHETCLKCFSEAYLLCLVTRVPFAMCGKKQAPKLADRVYWRQRCALDSTRLQSPSFTLYMCIFIYTHTCVCKMYIGTYKIQILLCV